MREKVEFFPVIVVEPGAGSGFDPVRVRVAAAGRVAAGDVVVGYAPAVRGAVGRPLMRMGYQAPYTARPRPYASGCVCGSCEALPNPHGPLAVVLSTADDEGSRWAECEVYAEGEPVLVVPSADWQ
ncbi:hypothetical protein ACFC26_21725 [Kitasatospora purpeofusca]|uniref:hypothetical protein n=1 Tax=Kitasatospora purpeofusca TaxID=67352 RepID=UPI0035E27A82